MGKNKKKLCQSAQLFFIAYYELSITISMVKKKHSKIVTKKRVFEHTIFF